MFDDRKEQVKVPLVAGAVDHRRLKHNRPSIKPFLSFALRLRVWSIASLRSLDAGEIDKRLHFVAAGLEELLRQPDIDIEVDLRRGDVLRVMRLTRKMDNGIDARGVDVAEIVP